MRVTMLVPAMKNCVPCNLRRIVMCVAYKEKMRVVRYRNVQPILLSVSSPNFAACKNYNTEHHSKPHTSLPMLIDGAIKYTPSLLTPLKLVYLSLFRIIPHIDMNFDVFEVMAGARYATSVISKALANKNFESLHGLVAEDAIETLSTKIETLSPNQRQLIALDEKDIVFYVLSDIEVTKGEEHSIQVTIICHYDPNKEEHEHSGTTILDFSKSKHLVCNYIFTRKYINKIGGPWIATFVNHFSI